MRDYNIYRTLDGFQEMIGMEVYVITTPDVLDRSMMNRSRNTGGTVKCEGSFLLCRCMNVCMGRDKVGERLGTIQVDGKLSY